MHGTYHPRSDLSTGNCGADATGLSGRSFMRSLMDGLRRKIGFCDDPPSLKLWRTGVPDQARPTGRRDSRQPAQQVFAKLFSKKR